MRKPKPTKIKKHRPQFFPDAMPPVFVKAKKRNPKKRNPKKRVREIKYESRHATALIRG